MIVTDVTRIPAAGRNYVVGIVRQVRVTFHVIDVMPSNVSGILPGLCNLFPFIPCPASINRTRVTTFYETLLSSLGSLNTPLPRIFGAIT